MCPIKPLEIDTRQEGSAVVVTLAGHISTMESQVVAEAFERLIAEGATLLAVDMSRVDIITSDGLGVLIRARKAVTENGGRLIIFGLVGNIRDVFKMTRLDKIFTLCESADDAVAALAS